MILWIMKVYLVWRDSLLEDEVFLAPSNVVGDFKRFWLLLSICYPTIVGTTDLQVDPWWLSLGILVSILELNIILNSIYNLALVPISCHKVKTFLSEGIFLRLKNKQFKIFIINLALSNIF